MRLVHGEKPKYLPFAILLAAKSKAWRKKSNYRSSSENVSYRLHYVKQRYTLQ